MAPIYLDHNGTTPIDPEVREAMLPYLGEHFGNPSSSHHYGRAPKEAIRRAREQVARLIGCQPEELAFTAGATEANNWVIKGLADHPHIVTTRVEHASILEPCRYLERRGWAEVTYLEVDFQGAVSPQQVHQALRPNTRLVSLMHANNETGTILPVAEIAGHCRPQAWLHTDAAQSLGKIPVQVDQLQVDFLTVAGHKLYAPKGIGALYIRSGCQLEALLHGAGQESGRRSGTECVPLIVGLGAACARAERDLAQTQARLTQLRDLLADLLRDRTAGRVTLNGSRDQRLPNTLSLNFLGVTGAELLARCPELAASTGPACHDGAVRLSHVLAAMGVDPQEGRGAVRLTLGRSTGQAEVERAADQLVAAYQALTVAPVEGGLGVA